jgi:acetylglutamate kinase
LTLTPREVVLRFLASIGRPAEAAQYLQVFQHERPEQFAVIHVSDAVAANGLDALLASLRFLAQLDLHPVLVLGVVTPRGARRAAERVAAALAPTAAQVAAPGDAAAIARAGGIAVVPLLEDADGAKSGRMVGSAGRPSGGANDEDGRFDALRDLVTALGTTKLIFLGRRSGLQPTGGPVVSLVDVTVDLPELAPRLAPSAKKLLRQVARILDQVPHRLTVSVTSPLDLLRELFTVKGAGTLIRRGSRVERHASWATLDADRLVALIEEAFGRPLVPGFRGRPFAAAFVADDYRGAAIVDDTALGPYLSKFAVTTVARGEGVGRDLWRPLVADYPRLYWRSRTDNPITSWYREQCDGFQRITIGGVPWVALWRGLPAGEVAAAIEYCATAPPDFVG